MARSQDAANRVRVEGASPGALKAVFDNAYRERRGSDFAME